MPLWRRTIGLTAAWARRERLEAREDCGGSNPTSGHIGHRGRTWPLDVAAREMIPSMPSSQLTVTAHAAAATAAMIEAASIWASAKARRDEAPVPDSQERSLADIRDRMGMDGATLLLAERDAQAIAFALLAPRDDVLEVFYVAVHADHWGGGLATLLLRAIDDHARMAGHSALELWVIEDNHRAISTYERAGWVTTDELQTQPSGQTERRLRRHVGGRP